MMSASVVDIHGRVDDVVAGGSEAMDRPPEPPLAPVFLRPPLVVVPFDVSEPQQSRWQRTRVFVKQRVVAHPAFDRITLVFILANCVFLALDNPLDSPQSRIQHVLAISDMVRASHCACAAHVTRCRVRGLPLSPTPLVLVPRVRLCRYFWRCSHSR
jgi:hypothetical protein